ncbi:uncharacterized protein LOC127831844 isoform X2 [Dreissena polymorpha]|uniref:Uncharacterized protein n=2 Tax=Dreissena polymorpha TaxID=45954 RepID=A0A9D4GY06_DREPO|nr:uncharacterized protein LOC127831844 isoform X2 [Dreissena polymorpha]XP_052212883.1 uncharacterized protein LOC127831844 isoform X2 [Dreissena polymorpha]XP_052212884.1 uncharacterized protein LOC127831844 isoform X2 [Dreissena polymorpha]XP_052212886.1 uncharacterized protein LOC127831844 isoform X2 [Dreissena polymorpha]KAH3821942.1 hypothetical protein DPMN_123710 [Dreissena polymorpha]
MRFWATVVLFVCVSASVAALLSHRHVVKGSTVPPTTTSLTNVTSTWPYGFMEFASLWAKCREWQLFNPSKATDGANRSEMGSIGIACTGLLDAMKDMKTDSGPEKEETVMAEFNANFPLLQCTNLQINREEIMAVLEHDTNAINDDPFLSMTARLAEMCDSEFKAYADQKKINRPQKRNWWNVINIVNIAASIVAASMVAIGR